MLKTVRRWSTLLQIHVFHYILLLASAGVKPTALPHKRKTKKYTNIWDLCVGSKDYKLNSEKREWKFDGVYVGLLFLLVLSVRNDCLELGLVARPQFSFLCSSSFYP